VRSSARIGWWLLPAAFLLLASCAAGTGIYDKPGLTYAEWKRDDAECRRAASEGEGGVLDREAYARCLRARGYSIRVE
jgi:hypothetical protein